MIRVGDLGAGMAAKIALMVISFGKLAATYEGLLLARAAGVDLADFAAIVRHSEAQSGMHDFFIRARGELFDGAGPLGAIGPHESPKSQKDLSAALELARRHGAVLPLVALVHDEMPAVWGIAGPGAAGRTGRSPRRQRPRQSPRRRAVAMRPMRNPAAAEAAMITNSGARSSRTSQSTSASSVFNSANTTRAASSASQSTTRTVCWARMRRSCHVSVRSVVIRVLPGHRSPGFARGAAATPTAAAALSAAGAA